MKLPSWFASVFFVSCILGVACGPSVLGTPVSNGTGGGSGAGGDDGASSATSTSASNSTVVASSSSSSSSASSSHASSASSSSASSSSASSSSASSSSGGGVPTTCAQADTLVGCCTAAGVLYYCNTATDPAPTEQVCAAGTVCGWSDLDTEYECVASPGGADPSNMYPLLCQ